MQIFNVIDVFFTESAKWDVKLIEPYGRRV